MNLSNEVKGLQHLGIPVSDIEKSKQWYVGTLGFQVIHEATIPGSEGNIQVAFLKLNDFVIEMYQLYGEELNEIKSRRHGHIDHIALDVADIEEVHDRLNKEGIATIEGYPRYLPFWDKGVRFLTILGPDDEKIEFNQRLE